MDNLRLDVYAKRKKIVKNKLLLDKRKFRSQMTYQEILFLRLIKEIDIFNVADSTRLANELIKVKNYQNLNFRLLILVYLYFSSKNLDISIVTKNFDNDFELELKKIEQNNLFPKLSTNESIYKFRQDFIMYLILISNMEETTVLIDEEAVDNYDPNEYEEKIDENMTEFKGLDI